MNRKIQNNSMKMAVFWDVERLMLNMDLTKRNKSKIQATDMNVFRSIEG
jgi:hypothetical protein